MHLDVLTLVAMGSFVSACAGVMLLGAWWQNRKTPALALWGLADLLIALGIVSLILGPVWRLPGACLLALAPGLIWKAARSFDHKPAPLVVALLGAMLTALAIAAPAARQFAEPLSVASGAIYLFAAATALWLGRKEHLVARWPLFLLTGVHAGVLLIGTYSILNGSILPGEVPSVASLFGIIHFESIVFTLGTSVFLLALVNERNEAASRKAARIDPLTGIANRAAFMETAERVMDRCRREDAPVSVMMWDLDRFKTINDTHGHAIGDAVIRQFCDLVSALLRPNDVFGRIGGEEFAAVLGCSSIEVAAARAERIRVAFADSCGFVENDDVDATVSCGLAVSHNAEEPLSTLLGLADAALYRAKAEGRNRVKRAEQPKRDERVIRVA
jgi:diguanylate cyclase (GGDEF)-like protein